MKTYENPIQRAQRHAENLHHEYGPNKKAYLNISFIVFPGRKRTTFRLGITTTWSGL